MTPLENIVEAVRASEEIEVGDFNHGAWGLARPARVARYWSGEEAPVERHAEARLIWTGAALGVRFEYRQAEPFVMSAAPSLERKSLGLWNRDVCEIFVAPDPSAPGRYFEFEAAPNGEWLDLAVQLSPRGRETDWNFRSGMRAAARVNGDRVTIAMRLPWKSIGRVPSAGERWRANLFRCVGAGETRGYIAWQPTHTPEPSFHVPEKFGWLRFK
jgi:hypothetical protein